MIEMQIKDSRHTVRAQVNPVCANDVEDKRRLLIMDESSEAYCLLRW